MGATPDAGAHAARRYFIQGERSTFATNSSVLGVGEDGSLFRPAVSILDGGGKTGWLYGLSSRTMEDRAECDAHFARGSTSSTSSPMRNS